MKSPAARKRLEVSKKPYFQTISRGIALGYRRNEGPGTWVLRATVGRTWEQKIGIADDEEKADGVHVLSYEQAEALARTRVRFGDDGDTSRPKTLGEAIEAYKAHLETNRGDLRNYRMAISRFRDRPALLAKPVHLLLKSELVDWRNSLSKKPKLSRGTDGKPPSAATINRVMKTVKAVLNLAKENDDRITSDKAWSEGLRSLPGASKANNVVLTIDEVLRLVDLAYERNHEFGMLIDTLAVTGTRADQVARILVRDLQADRPDPRIMMPGSAKGRGDREAKRETRRPVSITHELAATLKQAASGRGPSEKLLVRDGKPWRSSDVKSGCAYFDRDVTEIIAAAGLAGRPQKVTLYALRHSSITRQLLANVPIRVVAASHNTSVQMIEGHYSESIDDHSDALTRSSFSGFKPPAAANVVPMQRKRKAS